MLRVFIALNLFLLNIYACQGGYSSCAKKVKDSNSITNQTIKIPITKHKRLVFSTVKPKEKILKHDPFLSLYIVEDKKGFKYPFKTNISYPSGIAAISEKASKEVRIVKEQIGLSKLGILKEKVNTPAILTNSCCSLEGIVTSNGVIDKEYLIRFINTTDVRYADIGIRVNDTKKGVVVSSIDPFMKDNPFKIGDYILSMDGRKVKYSSILMKRILFSTVGSAHTIQIKRDNKILNMKVKSQKRVSGGYKIETYLEKYGITFDKNLYITKIDTTKKDYALKIGDRLLQVNSKAVKNQEDVMKYISDFKSHPSLLFERKDFQFFVNMD